MCNKYIYYRHCKTSKTMIWITCRPKTGRETKRVPSLSAHHRTPTQLKRSQSMGSTSSPRVAPSLPRQMSEGIPVGISVVYINYL